MQRCVPGSGWGLPVSYSEHTQSLSDRWSAIQRRRCILAVSAGLPLAESERWADDVTTSDPANQGGLCVHC